MNDIEVPEISNSLEKVYDVEALDAAEFLAVGRTRLSQLTSNGVFSFEKRKVGFRYRNFYDRSELESYINLRKLSLQAQFKTRVGASSSKICSESLYESEKQHLASISAAGQRSSILRQATEASQETVSPEINGCHDGIILHVPCTAEAFRALNKPFMKHQQVTRRPLKKALDLLKNDESQNNSEQSLIRIEKQIKKLKKKLADVELLCLRTQLLLKQTRSEMSDQKQSLKALQRQCGPTLSLLHNIDLHLKNMEKEFFQRKKKSALRLDRAPGTKRKHKHKQHPSVSSF